MVRISGCPSGACREAGWTARLPNLPAEILVLVVRQMLVAKEDHQVFHQRVVHFLELLVAERPRQIDPADLGADMRRQLGDLDRLVGHPRILPLCAGANVVIASESDAISRQGAADGCIVMRSSQ